MSFLEQLAICLVVLAQGLGMTLAVAGATLLAAALTGALLLGALVDFLFDTSCLDEERHEQETTSAQQANGQGAA